MGTGPRFEPRRRAAALITAAVIVIAAASVAYLRTNLTSKPGGLPSPSVKPTMVTRNPVTYDFVTPSVGWAVEVFGTPPGPTGEFRVYKTTDGAEHWQQQLDLGSSSAGFFPVSVQFLDRDHGFIGVGNPFEQLNRTSDGGTTWNSLPLPSGSTRIGGVAFADASHGWLLAGGLVSHLYETLDAGDSWQRLPDPPVDADHLSLQRATAMWMGSFGLGPPHVYTSVEAGQSWQRHDLPVPSGGSWDPAAGYKVLGELLPGKGVVVSVFCECTPSGPFHFASFDSGITWRSVQFPLGVIGYQDDFHWWAINTRTLSKSADAGQTWTRVSDKLPDLQFFVPHVLDSKHAWAMLFVEGGYGLALTDDGGLHWTRAAVPPSA